MADKRRDGRVPVMSPARPLMVLCLLAACCGAARGTTMFHDFVDRYGYLSTVAGRGEFRGRTFNGWSDAMEGGPAIDAELSRPHMTMADLAGNLYIADKAGQAIRQVTPDGTIHTIAGTNVRGFNGDGPATQTQLNDPNGLYTFPDGTTYVLDLGNSRIRRLSTDGQLTTIVQDPDGIVAGRGLWVSPDQTLLYYASGDRIRRWTAAAGVTTYATGFVQLGNLDVDPADGTLVAADRGGNRVYRIGSDGSKQPIAGNGTTSGGGDGQNALDTGLNEVRGVFFTPDGGYLLATHDGGQIWYVDAENIIHLLIDGDAQHTHAGDGTSLWTPGKKISEPRAVTLAPNGDLLVTENDFGYVRVVPRLIIGDMDIDRDIDFDDIGAFVLGLEEPVSYESSFGIHAHASGDTDGDRDLDFDDIAGFVSLIEGTPVEGAPRTTPEPSCYAIVGILSGCLLLWNRSRPRDRSSIPSIAPGRGERLPDASVTSLQSGKVIN